MRSSTTPSRDQQIAKLVPLITAEHEKQMLLELLQALHASQVAEILLEQNDYYEVLDELEKATAVHFPSWLVWYRRGNALWQLERYIEAIPSYHKSIALNPDQYLTYSWNGLSECYYATKKYDEGWRYFSELTQENPDRWQAWHCLGKIGGDRDKTISEETINSYVQAIALYHNEPNWTRSSENLKDYLEKHQAITRGREIFVGLTEKFPAYWILWHDRAWFESQNDDYQSAEASYQKAIAQHPEDGWHVSWQDLGWLYLQQNWFDKAVNAFSKAIKYSSEQKIKRLSSWQAFLGRAKAFQQLRQYSAAIADYEKAIKSLYGSRSPETYVSFGVCLEKATQFSRAFENYCQALKVDANYAPAREARETLLVILRRKLLDFLNKQFDLEELRTLCFHLNLDYDNLPGEGKQGKARELISYQVRISGEDYIPLRELIAEIEAMRPGVPLP